MRNLSKQRNESKGVAGREKLGVKKKRHKCEEEEEGGGELKEQRKLCLPKLR